VNFGVTAIKGYALRKNTHELRPATHKTCSLDAKLFLGIEKRPIFDQLALSISKKRNAQDTNDPKMCIKD